MNKIGKEIAWIGFYIVMFILIQVVIQFAFAGGYLVYYKMPLANLRNLFMGNVTLTIASTIVSSLITIFVFLKRHSVFAITVGKVVKCGEMCHIVVIRF